MPATGDELAALGHAFNGMAEALESTERRRQSLLADLAHELRIPLATLAGYVEGMADGVVAADDEAWKVLDAEITRLRRLVEDLEAVSRAAEQRLALRPAPTDPGALVSAAVQAAEPAFAAKGVALHASVDHPFPQLTADPDRLGEVMANLLGNALRHTSTGGRVEVTARGSGDEVELSVADTGEGIPTELLERVFERFFRVDPARARDGGGSGIGLTITRAIVEAHGGRVWAESGGPPTAPVSLSGSRSSRGRRYRPRAGRGRGDGGRASGTSFGSWKRVGASDASVRAWAGRRQGHTSHPAAGQ